MPEPESDRRALPRVLRENLSDREQGLLLMAARDERLLVEVAGIRSAAHAQEVIAVIRAKAARLLRGAQLRRDHAVLSEKDRTMHKGAADGTPPMKPSATPESFPSPFPDDAPPIAVEAAIELPAEVEGWFDDVRVLIARAMAHRASEAEFAELSERLICGPPAH